MEEESIRSKTISKHQIIPNSEDKKMCRLDLNFI